MGTEKVEITLTREQAIALFDRLRRYLDSTDPRGAAAEHATSVLPPDFVCTLTISGKSA